MLEVFRVDLRQVLLLIRFPKGRELMLLEPVKALTSLRGLHLPQVFIDLGLVVMETRRGSGCSQV